MNDYRVDLPAGATLQLQNADEVKLWRESHRRYVEDYHLSRLNDLTILGHILQQQVIAYRAQQTMNGMVPVLDANKVPTGQWSLVPPNADEVSTAVNALSKATAEIMKMEKALGIDKVTREAGGQHTLSNYLKTVKEAAHLRGLHISKRTLAYEAFVNEFRWRLRILLNHDAEDRAYHDLTPQKLLNWCNDELKALEEVDKKFARERGKIFVGKL